MVIVVTIGVGRRWVVEIDNIMKDKLVPHLDLINRKALYRNMTRSCNQLFSPSRPSAKERTLFSADFYNRKFRIATIRVI